MSLTALTLFGSTALGPQGGLVDLLEVIGIPNGGLLFLPGFCPLFTANVGTQSAHLLILYRTLQLLVVLHPVLLEIISPSPFTLINLLHVVDMRDLITSLGILDIRVCSWK